MMMRGMNRNRDNRGMNRNRDNSCYRESLLYFTTRHARSPAYPPFISTHRSPVTGRASKIRLLRQLLHQATTGHQLNELNSESLMTRVFTHRYAQLDSRKNGLQDFVTEAAQKHTALLVAPRYAY